MRLSYLLPITLTAFGISLPAAGQTTLSPHQALSQLNTQGGSDLARWSLGATYSGEFGYGARAAFGSYLADDFALGLIVDVSQNRQEYLANAGFDLSQSLRLVGTVGRLQENRAFTDGGAREAVDQMEYGISLKGSYDAGMVRGFELNAYRAVASTDSSAVQAGTVSGLQAMTNLTPAQGAHLKIGAGYEWLELTSGETAPRFTFQTIGSQRLTEMLSLGYSAKLGASENSYGAGLTWDLAASAARPSSLSVDYTRITGRNGAGDDSRVALNWVMPLGGAATDGAAARNVAMASMGNAARSALLDDVLKRPDFLPQASVVAAEATKCTLANLISNPGDFLQGAGRYTVSATSGGVDTLDFTTPDPNFYATYNIYTPINSTGALLASNVVINGPATAAAISYTSSINTTNRVYGIAAINGVCVVHFWRL